MRISKYIHSCGICHNDFHLQNMMFLGKKGFIIGTCIYIIQIAENDTAACRFCLVVKPKNVSFNIILDYNNAIKMFEGSNEQSGTDCRIVDWQDFHTTLRSFRSKFNVIEYRGFWRVYAALTENVFKSKA